MLSFQKKVNQTAESGELLFLGLGKTGRRWIGPPERGNVLALAPHPDDPDAVAVALRSFASGGCRVRYVIVCTSPSGVTDSFALKHARERGRLPVEDLERYKRELRQEEQRESASLAGFVESVPRFLSLEETERGSLIESETNAQAIEEVLAANDPDIVLLPYGEDTNLDHALTFRYFRKGALKLAGKRGRPVLGLYNRDPKTVRITERLAVPFNNEIACWKARLLVTHGSQHERNLEQRGCGFDQRILAVNRESWREACRSLENDLKNVCPSDVAYAETFQVELLS
ncbi:MAG TPA: PIG-L family deacetylase [archaeon]|nr:PIG-L family deacetylase [archaeon]